MPIIHPPKNILAGDLAFRIFYLAYKNAEPVPRSQPMVMTLLDKIIELSEAQVLVHLVTKPGFFRKDGDLNILEADVIFGRPVNLILWFKTNKVPNAPDGYVEYPEAPPKRALQTWCGKFPTYADLITRAIESLNKIGEPPA